MTNKKRPILTVITLAFALTHMSLVADPEKPRWEQSADGVTISLQQILPDQVKAFYIGRGFSIEQIKPYANRCVYTLILRNDTQQGAVHSIQSDWHLQQKTVSITPKKTAEWLAEFKQRQVTPAALIAFRFAQFPDEQLFTSQGDWNQGMFSTNLPLASQFDLHIRWKRHDQTTTMILSGVTCLE